MSVSTETASRGEGQTRTRTWFSRALCRAANAAKPLDPTAPPSVTTSPGAGSASSSLRARPDDVNASRTRLGEGVTGGARRSAWWNDSQRSYDKIAALRPDPESCG